VNRLLNKTLYIRTLSGAGLLIVVLGTVLWSPYSMLALMLLLTIGSMNEFYRIARLKQVTPLRLYPIIIGAGIVITSFFVATGAASPRVFAWVLPAVFALFIVGLYDKSGTHVENIVWEIGGIVYVAVPMALLTALPLSGVYGTIIYTPSILLSILFIVWANDVGAYLTGVAFGRRKLFERISPNKSWEGFFGGVACAILVGGICGYASAPSPNSILVWAGAGAVIAISGVFGDLIESMLKRSVGIKDSGNILPGHGGFLDRFDALILAAPFVYTYFTVIFTC